MKETTTVMSEHDTYGEASGEVNRLNGYYMNPNIKYTIQENPKGKYEVIRIQTN